MTVLFLDTFFMTLKRDRELKAPAYGRSQIHEYWILDVQEYRLLVFRTPNAAGYTTNKR